MPVEVLTLVEWLGLRPASYRVQEKFGWWGIPSANSPRWYIPTCRKRWGGALDLVPSPVKKLGFRFLLDALSLARRAAHYHGDAGSPLEEWLREIYPGEAGFGFAIYAGTPSIFVKDTVQCQDETGQTLAYLKVPRGVEAWMVVHHEAGVLEELGRRFPNEAFYPTLLGRRGGSFLQSAPPASGRSQKTINPESILSRLAAGWHEEHPWSTSPVRAAIIDAAALLQAEASADWSSPLEQASEFLSRMFGADSILHPLSHGDFVPWNLRPGPFAFDWEWAAPRLPLHDRFHYLWMPAMLRSRRPLAVARLWEIWRAYRPLTSMDEQTSSGEFVRACGVSYLAWQLSFYSAATIRNQQDPDDYPILANLRFSLTDLMGA